MPTEAYARSVVDKLMRGRVSPEIWEGKMSWNLYFLITFLPLQILVSDLTMGKILGLMSILRTGFTFARSNWGS